MRSLSLPLLAPAVAAAVVAGSVPAAAPAAAAGVQAGPVDWGSPHGHPLELTPGGARLLAVNTADGRLEVFEAGGPELLPLAAIPVGLEPISVRARNDREAWVVDHVGDAIYVVDLGTGRVRATLGTDDEPCDVVFAGVPQRAFVSCSQANSVLVFDPASLASPPLRVALEAEDPRALAVAPDGRTVYAAVFESGNGTTVLGGGADLATAFPPNAVDDPSGPWGGANPPPNEGASFDPPWNPDNPPPPRVALVVRRDGEGRWLDDNGGDWTSLVSGSGAALSGRPVGWELADRDVAAIDVDTLEVAWIEGLLNLNMALAVNPVDGRLAVVGTDATNEVRYEPNLRGTFLRVRLALVEPGAPGAELLDLNPHLDYATPQLPQAQRDRSLGDPRGIVWNAAGTRAWVTGMGSHNVVVLDATGQRAGLADTIEVGDGPTGLALDEVGGRLFVLARFEAAISVVDLATEVEVARVPFHDPTPAAVAAGRRHLYDTHERSGLGHLSCASCHVDTRMDRLAWDVGDPAGAMVSTEGMNLAGDHPLLPQGFPAELHPMKGPMLTQSLVDVVGKEPLHWRGDRGGLGEFNGAYVSLLGDDEVLTPQELDELEQYLASLHYPPNPYRTLENDLPEALELTGHFSTGTFSPAGQPLPNGDATRGLALFRPPHVLDGSVACATCHTLPTGEGPDHRIVGGVWEPIPPGPGGERHQMVTLDGTVAKPVAIPHLRNLYERTGFHTTVQTSRAGFGYGHDGTVDSIERFLDFPLFQLVGEQDVADLLAFLLAFSGSDLPDGSVLDLYQAPGFESRDAHAAVGRATTLVDAAAAPAGQVALLATLRALADGDEVGLVAHRRDGGSNRGYVYLGNGAWQCDRASESLTTAQLEALAAPGGEVTFLVVPRGEQMRTGVDRDMDLHFDGDERDAATDPASTASIPGPCPEGPPPSPTGLAAAAAGPGLLELTWDAAGAGTAHVLERSADGAASFDHRVLLPAGVARYTDVGLDCGGAYDYRLSARTCGGTSSPVPSSAAAGACDALTADVPAISLAAGGRQRLTLRAPLDQAGHPYALVGSLSGTSPGLDLGPGPGVLPLNVDAYFVYTLTDANAPPLVNTTAVLDATAHGYAAVDLPPGANPNLAGLTFHHACVTLDPGTLAVEFASNATPLDLLP